ncbi:MAG: ribbon-helix-helix protein, CopG family [Acidobacteria bacterium]|jgi:predicted DNA-binding protein|nr:ribbon-helix-helix protein, CopG family [Acidobacteriota bacterium]
MRVQTLRMPDLMARKLDEMARASRRTKSSFILEALEQYLENREDVEIALSRIRDPGAKWISHGEVKRAAFKD